MSVDFIPITVKLPPEVFDKVEALAERRSLSLDSVIVESCSRHVAGNKEGQA